MNVEAETATRRCLLQDAAGRVEACAGAGCPFWEEGGAVLEAGCGVERMFVGLAHRPEDVQRLLKARLELDRARRGGDQGRSLFYRLGG